MTALLIDLFLHNAWANGRAVDWCAAQPDEMLDQTVRGTFGTARATLVHLLSAEERYVGRLRGAFFDDPLDQDGPFPGFDDLRQRAVRSGEALVDLARTTTPGATYRTHDEGRDWEIDTPLLLTQAINHATEHRTHISTTLTALGAELVGLDCWSWAEETGALRDVTS